MGGEGFWAEVLEEVFEGVVDHFQGEFDEMGGVPGAVSVFEGLVVVLLMILDEGFEGDELESGMVVVEKNALPKATDAAIAILEGVDEFELVVEDAGANEEVEVVFCEEGEEIVHEVGNTVGLRSDVGDGGALEDADVFTAPFPGIWDEVLHHLLVGLEEGLGLERIEVGQAIVCLDGIEDFPDFFLWSEDALALEEGRDLVEVEGVSLDGKAPVNGADAVGLAEMRLGLGLIEAFDPPDQSLDLADPAEDERGDGERRSHGVIVSRDTIVSQAGDLIPLRVPKEQNVILGCFLSEEKTSKPSFKE